jgi:hypothetical protein
MLSRERHGLPVALYSQRNASAISDRPRLCRVRRTGIAFAAPDAEQQGRFARSSSASAPPVRAECVGPCLDQCDEVLYIAHVVGALCALIGTPRSASARRCGSKKPTRWG